MVSDITDIKKKDNIIRETGSNRALSILVRWSERAIIYTTQSRSRRGELHRTGGKGNVNTTYFRMC